MEKSERYLSLTKKHTPSSHVFKKAVCAFFGGGFICALGEALAFIYLYIGLDKMDAYLCVTLSFILLGSLATALGFF